MRVERRKRLNFKEKTDLALKLQKRRITNRESWMRKLSSLFAAIALAAFASQSSASIVFQANSTTPTNLEVVVTSPIVFTANAASSGSFFDVHLVDVWTSSQPTGFVGGSTTAPLTLAGPFSSTTAGVAGIVVSGVADANDLVLTWGFGALRSVSIGDEITFGVGTYTLPGFLGTRPVPNTKASQISVFFNDDSNRHLSSGVLVSVGAVPEPATISLALLSLAGLAAQGRLKASRQRKAISAG